ncbi:MAG: hypothetical protein EHM30_07750 [Desulfobacteraceae bacterium]|nr:MAG: hypothetical protein EHM30_07750 [Desulfobacteraceae bacterium]
MFVITVLRLAVARAFPIVIPECFLPRHNSWVVNNMTTIGVREQNTLVNIHEAGKVLLQEFVTLHESALIMDE